MTLEKWLIAPGETRVIDAEGIHSLKVSLIGGQVDIIAHDEPTARIEVHSVSGKELKVTVNGDHLEVDHPQLRWENFIEAFRSFGVRAKAEISIAVPRDVALKFGVINASALIAGLAGDSKISTVSGDIVLDGTAGNIELNSVSGEVSVREHAGRINAHTVSGDVTVTGPIERLSVDGVSGNVLVDATGQPDEITSNTVSGDLTVRLDVDTPVRYKVSTVSGKFQLDTMEYRGLRGQQSGTSGDTTGWWLDVNVNSVSGNVAILHTAGASDAGGVRTTHSTTEDESPSTDDAQAAS